jgi:hypothetical protein
MNALCPVATVIRRHKRNFIKQQPVQLARFTDSEP